MVRTFLFAVLMLSPGAVRKAPQPYGLRPDGTAVLTLAPPGKKLLVLFFVASDCPVSNRTFPEMRRVRQAFEPSGVAVWYVYPDQGEEANTVRAHQQAYDAGGAALLDSSGRLARLAQARVTPEVAVLVPDASAGWKPIYTGRVDDRFVRLGLERPAATEHFAERVLTAALHGAPIEKPTGMPVGCGILSSAP